MDMAYDGLRGWLEQVDAWGELRRINGADCRLEMGALAEVAAREMDPPPALLFDQVPGHPPGHRVLFGMLSSLSRIALTLGLPRSMSSLELVRAIHDRLADPGPPQPPRRVRTGPVLEHMHTGDEVDLSVLPAPLHHEGDGGRYLGTGCAVITRDPDTGRVNLGTYRVMVVDRRRLTSHINPGKDGRLHRDRWFERGLPCPVAICFGQDPLFFLAAGREISQSVTEYEFCGAVRGRPVDVVEGPVTGLPIPADAEVVVEGEIVPETVPEGPFGEWAGYYANNGLDPVPEPLIHVKSLLHRSEPILTSAHPGRPPHDTAVVSCIVGAGAIWDQLEQAGVPDVRGVWRLPAGGGRNFTVVSIRQRYAGHARQAGMVAAQCQAGSYVGRYVIVVDDDIDPTRTDDVLWALGTRSDPAESIDLIRCARSSSADPRVPMERKGTRGHLGAANSVAVIDATRPYEWRDAFPPVAEASPELLASVRARWGAALAAPGPRGAGDGGDRRSKPQAAAAEAG